VFQLVQIHLGFCGRAGSGAFDFFSGFLDFFALRGCRFSAFFGWSFALAVGEYFVGPDLPLDILQLDRPEFLDGDIVDFIIKQL
jgi:hypothetical protein